MSPLRPSHSCLLLLVGAVAVLPGVRAIVTGPGSSSDPVELIFLESRLGTPCIRSCAHDPSSDACKSCCQTVHHEVDWKCQAASPLDRVRCCGENWDPHCWNVASDSNKGHACNQCGAQAPCDFGFQMLGQGDSGVFDTSLTGGLIDCPAGRVVKTKGRCKFELCTPDDADTCCAETCLSGYGCTGASSCPDNTLLTLNAQDLSCFGMTCVERNEETADDKTCCEARETCEEGNGCFFTCANDEGVADRSCADFRSPLVIIKDEVLVIIEDDFSCDSNDEETCCVASCSSKFEEAGGETPEFFQCSGGEKVSVPGFCAGKTCVEADEKTCCLAPTCFLSFKTFTEATGRSLAADDMIMCEGMQTVSVDGSCDGDTCDEADAATCCVDPTCDTFFETFAAGGALVKCQGQQTVFDGTCDGDTCEEADAATCCVAPTCDAFFEIFTELKRGRSLAGGKIMCEGAKLNKEGTCEGTECDENDRETCCPQFCEEGFQRLGEKDTNKLDCAAGQNVVDEYCEGGTCDAGDKATCCAESCASGYSKDGLSCPQGEVLVAYANARSHYGLKECFLGRCSCSGETCEEQTDDKYCCNPRMTCMEGMDLTCGTLCQDRDTVGYDVFGLCAGAVCRDSDSATCCRGRCDAQFEDYRVVDSGDTFETHLNCNGRATVRRYQDTGEGGTSRAFAALVESWGVCAGYACNEDDRAACCRAPSCASFFCAADNNDHKWCEQSCSGQQTVSMADCAGDTCDAVTDLAACCVAPKCDTLEVVYRGPGDWRGKNVAVDPSYDVTRCPGETELSTGSCAGTTCDEEKDRDACCAAPKCETLYVDYTTPELPNTKVRCKGAQTVSKGNCDGLKCDDPDDAEVCCEAPKCAFWFRPFQSNNNCELFECSVDQRVSDESCAEDLCDGTTDRAACCVACDITHASSYSSGCVVEGCDTGYQPSSNKAKCEACDIHATSYSTGCVVEGCDTGYQLSSNKAKCEATTTTVEVLMEVDLTAEEIETAAGKKEFLDACTAAQEEAGTGVVCLDVKVAPDSQEGRALTNDHGRGLAILIIVTMNGPVAIMMDLKANLVPFQGCEQACISTAVVAVRTTNASAAIFSHITTSAFVVLLVVIGVLLQ